MVPRRYALAYNVIMKHAGITALIIASAYLSMFVVDVLTTPPILLHEQELAEAHLEEHNLPTPQLAFYHDGCTAWPDYLLWHDFREACLAHDISYWAGGSLEQKRAADLALWSDIAHTGPLGAYLFGPIMFVGVHYFGNNWVSELLGSEWGYGWEDKPWR